MQFASEESASEARPEVLRQSSCWLSPKSHHVGQPKFQFILNRRGVAMAEIAEHVDSHRSPGGFRAIGIFLLFGAAMAAYAGTTLIWRGTVLDKLWALNPRAYEQLAPLGRIVGLAFLLLSAALVAAAAGWFKRRIWGWGLATGVILTQVVGDLFNLLRGDFLRGGIGCVIAGSLLFYLLRPKVRIFFHHRRVSSDR